MKFSQIGLIVLLFPLISLAQLHKKDSIENLLKETTDKEKRYELLNKLAPLLINFEKPEKAKVYLEELQKISHENGEYKNESKAYRAFSMIYQNQANYSAAFEQINKAIEIDEAHNCLKCYLLDINQLGRIYIDMQKPEKAIEVYKKAIKKSGNNSGKEILRVLAIIYGNLGIAYHKIYQKEKEINAYLKQAELARLSGYIDQKSKAFYNIGYLYMNMEQYSKAEKYFFKAMSDSTKVKNKDYIFMNYHSLGLLYSRWNKFDQALKYDSLALGYFRKQNYKLYIFDVLNNIAVVYQRMKQYDKALIYNKKAVKLADSMQHKLIQIGGKLSLVKTLLHLNKNQEAEQVLMQISRDTVDRHNFNKHALSDFWNYKYKVYKRQKKYQPALEAFEKHHNISQSLSNKERDIKISELEIKYQTEVKEKELIIKEKELLKQKIAKQQLMAGISVAGFLLVLLGIFAVKTYRKHLSEKQKLSELTNKVNKLTKQLKYNEQKIIENKTGLNPVVMKNATSNIYQTEKKGYLHKLESQNLKNFRHYLQIKYKIDKPILIEVWENIAKGISRKEFAKKFNYSENTVKAWRKELYQLLKQYDQTNERYSDYKATGLFYQALLEFLLESK